MAPYFQVILSESNWFESIQKWEDKKNYCQVKFYIV